MQNRVNTIRRLIPHNQWKFCNGEDNPADLPSRGMLLSELVGSALWRYGPPWLGLVETRVEGELVMPEECMKEMKVGTQHVLVTSFNSHGVGKIMNAKNFSTLGKLLRVTAYVVKFCKILKVKIQQRGSSRYRPHWKHQRCRQLKHSGSRRHNLALGQMTHSRCGSANLGSFWMRECGDARVDWGMQMFLMLPGTD